MPARACAFLLFLAHCAVGEELTEQSFAPIRDEILPTEAEQKWLAIGWRPTMWTAVVEGYREEKPILLYAMNGHPLGCT